MPSLDASLVPELFETVLYAVGAVALTLGGLVTEYTSLQYVGGGEVGLAVWFAALGGILLYAGLYGLGYQKVLATYLAAQAE